LLGESGVGKSSLVLRLINNEFRPYYETTLGAAFTQKTLNYENTNYKFLIWDTAGQEKFHSLASIYYKDAQVALIIYDVNNHKTFDIMNKWIKELKEQASDNI
jgi:small GTP-binding protein